MRNAHWFVTWLAAGAVSAALSSCLPTDTRPTPETLHMTAGSDDALRTGFDTADGWHIIYRRFLLALGQVSMTGDACNNYSAGGGTGYSRIFDMLIAGPQKVTVLYGTGPCELGFRVGGLSADTVLGAGVTEADKTFMRTPGSDAYTSDRGVTLQVEGSAAKGGITKRFAWSFRGGLSYTKCVAADGSPGATLSGTGSRTIDILIPDGALFADGLDPSRAVSRFDLFALADDQGNADGEVTLSELAAIPQTAADIQVGDAGVDTSLGPGSGGGSLASDAGAAIDPSTWMTLQDVVYLGLVPHLPRFDDTGACTIRTRSQVR